MGTVYRESLRGLQQKMLRESPKPGIFALVHAKACTVFISGVKGQGRLCGHPLPAMANSWTRGAALRHTTAPISAQGLHPVVRELLLISRPTEGRRLSWPEHTVG